MADVLGIRIQENDIVFAGMQEEVYDPANASIKNIYDSASGLQVLENVHNTQNVLHQYHNGVLVWDEEGSIAPPPPIPTTNFITLKNPSINDEVNSPVQIGRQFVEGEIANYPQVYIDDVAQSTQANVKTRWPDGSVKHAIISFVLDSILASESIVVRFANQTSTSDTAMTKAAMLAFDWDAKLQFAFPTSELVSARDMLTTDDYFIWCSGGIAQTIILADHSVARKYDVGSDDFNSIRPMFHVTFWPTINKYSVRYVVGIENTETMQDQLYNIDIFIDASNELKHSKNDVAHGAGGRWSLKFWGGTAPEELAINHNIAYLIEANALASFDTTCSIPEERLASVYTTWQGKDTGIYDAGWWVTQMGAGGGRPEIGVWCEWQADYLFSGDIRMQEIFYKQAELAMAWPINLREGDPNILWFDREATVPAMGMPISIAPGGRTSHHTGFLPFRWDYYTIEADHQINPVGDMLTAYAWPWQPNTAHFPNLAATQYLVSGDYAFFETTIFSAVFVTGDSNAADINGDLGRGPTKSEGTALGTTRGLAWALNQRILAEDLAPDDTPYANYWRQSNLNLLAVWAGVFNCANPYPEDAYLIELYDWAVTLQDDYYTSNGQVNDIGVVADGVPEYADNYTNMCDETMTGAANAPWQHNFLIAVLGRAKELGFASDNLLETFSYYNRMLFSDVTIDKGWLCAYVMPTQDLAYDWFLDIYEMVDGFVPAYIDDCWALIDWDLNWSEQRKYQASAACSYLQNFQYGSDAWTWCLNNINDKTKLYEKPKWTIIPRT